MCFVRDYAHCSAENINININCLKNFKNYIGFSLKCLAFTQTEVEKETISYISLS